MWTDSRAVWSPCGAYRYSLARAWGAGGRVCWVMLNPSTADEAANDPTVARCERRARALGYGEHVVVNLFGLRSTDPRRLYRDLDPVGVENDAAILLAARGADLVVCAWGNHGGLFNRGPAVLSALAASGIVPHVLKWTTAGHPGHPLYLPYTAQPFPAAAPGGLDGAQTEGVDNA